MSTRGVLVVGLSLVVLLAGVAPVVGITANAQRLAGDAGVVEDGPADRADAEAADRTDAANRTDDTVDRTADAAAQYKVSLDNVTVRTWLLRNSTVQNATVQEVVIQNVTTPDGARKNVTLTNVTVGNFDVERGRLKNVTATRLVVRNRSVLDVPGGDLFDPNVENRTLDRQWTKNATVAGVVIDRIAVDAAILCGNASLGQEAENGSAFDPTTNDDAPAVTVENGTAEEALVIRGAASNWSVGSVDEPQATNASLPQGCNRG